MGWGWGVPTAPHPDISKQAGCASSASRMSSVRGSRLPMQRGCPGVEGSARDKHVQPWVLWGPGADLSTTHPAAGKLPSLLSVTGRLASWPQDHPTLLHGRYLAVAGAGVGSGTLPLPWSSPPLRWRRSSPSRDPCGP